MKAVFTRFFSVLKANTPPSEKRYSSRKFLSLFLILFLAVGNVWGATYSWQPTSSSSSPISQTLENAVVIKAYDGAAVEEKQMDSSVKRYGVKIGASANDNLDAAYIEIKVVDASTNITAVLLGVSSAADGTKKYGAVCFSSTTANKDNIISGESLVSIAKKSGSIDDRQTLTVPEGTKMIRLYRKISKKATGLDTDLGDGSSIYVYSFSVTIESSAPAETFSVTYKAGLGTGGDVVDDNATTVADCSFTYEGKKFTGWNTKSDGTGTPYAVGDAVTEPLTLYAQWATTYVITYNKGANGTGDITAGEKIEGTDFTLSSERFTRDGFVQVGWSTSDGGEKVYDMGGVYANDAAIDLYPVWVEIAVYEATFACGDNPPTSWTFSNDGFSDTKATVAYVCKFVENNIKTPQQDGIADDYVAFAKNTKAVATYDLGAATTVASLDITLYGGSSSAFDEIIEYVGEDGTTVKKKYTNSLSAGNWKANEIKKNDVVADVRYIKVYGASKWVVMSAFSVSYIDLTPKYTLSFNKGEEDATGTMASVEYKAGATITIPNCEYSNSGKAFAGWSDGTNIYAAGSEYTMPASDVTFTAQWQLISDFDVKFFQGYGDPDAQIGETQSISTGEYATAPEDPKRTGYAFLGWSYDGTEAHIVDVATYGITAATNFTAMWKAVWTVTFDGAGNVIVEDGEMVASPDSPTQAEKIFQGWYNGESKYDFSSAVAGNLALTSKWADADPNHYVYAYNDDFHFDGVVYKTPEGKTTDPAASEATLNLTTPYTVYSGAEGITSIIATNGVYDYKKGADTKHVTAYLKLKKNDATSNLAFTIKSGYTAVLKIKMGGYSNNPVVTLKKGDDAVPATSGTIGGTATGKNYYEITYNLTAGTYVMTSADQTLYISHIDLKAAALPTYTVTYEAGDGTGADVVDADATEVRDGSTMFTAPEGKIFNGWKDGDNNDVEVGTIVTSDMTLTAQWINHYAVSFNLQGHGDAIDPQDIIDGEKATKPADPFVIGQEFGGWFTDAACTAGNEFDFETPITAATELFAKWTEFEGCALLYPALNGDALHVGDNVSVQSGSKGATIAIVGMKADGSSIAYSTNGLSLNGGSADVISVTLNSDMAVGTKISVTLIAASTGSRGLNLLNSTGGSVAGGTKLGWDDATTGAEATFSYTVTASDGLDGTNIFRLQRSNSVYLKCLKVESCGAAITYHNLTSAVNIAGKGTVTLGASSVREGKTTTAEYSAIDPLYEFVNWTVSGAGASVADATANPATITVGTEDAVVTLNLRLIPVKFTVEYYNGATLMGSEQVVVNEPPTASEIVTAKRGYVFEGWAMSSTATASDVINLNTITSDVAATIKLYAVYTEIPCPTEGTVFSMVVTAPAGTQYEENNDFGLEIGATYSGGKSYSGSKSTTKRIGEIDTNGEYSFNKNSDVAVKVALDCALQEGDVIIFTTSTKRELKIKKVVGTDLVTTSSKKYTIPAESPLIGEYDFYLMRDNSESTFKTLKVERPYTISFDMQGHGDAIEAQKLIAGDKVVEPTAPTADGWDFKGWYKESACTNAWDFENDIVAGTMALYAKWDVHVTNDATLKSLKYGSEAIALADGVFEYNIGLPALTASVPTLTAVANSATVHSLDIVDADAFDVDGKATSTVTVVSEDETVTNVYTVNFSKMSELPLLDVDNSIVWDFDNAGTQNNAFTDEVLANFPGVTNDATFRAQTLKATGAKIEDGYLQGSPILFHATKDGLLRVEFSNTGSKTRPYRYLVVNGERTAYKSNNTTHVTTAWIEVPAGDVTIEGECVEDANGECTSDNLNFYKIEYLAVGYTRDNLNPTNIATICLPNGGIMTGATLYKMAGKNEYNKLCFDEVQDNIMLAGNPYLFVPENGNTKINVYYTDELNAAAGNDNGLYGTYVRLSTVDDGQNSLLWGKYIISNNKYIYVDANNCNLAANRAYVVLNEVQPLQEQNPAPGLRRIVLGTNESQVATGVDQVQGDEVPTKMIINGQLFILRGEKMYDAQGKLVK